VHKDSGVPFSAFKRKRIASYGCIIASERLRPVISTMLAARSCRDVAAVFVK
jgi:hypothetical protein